MSSSHHSIFLEKLNNYSKEGLIPEKYQEILSHFYLSYKNSLETDHIDIRKHESVFLTYLEFIKKQFETPFYFEPFHKSIRRPLDYYRFGLDFMRPLVDMSRSSLTGIDNLNEVAEHLKQGHNIILLANHQTEADPQAINLLLENNYPSIASEMIFVAGERVTTDPLAIPFSMGCNLLCIYSKRYIDFPPEQKLKKQLHNKKTMALMSELLSEGGKIIYVAPSGGRDRLDEQGTVQVAPFDSQSVEMFYLMARKAKHPTFFYPMALATYDLLPPPETVQIELGELRHTQRSGIHVCFGSKIDMEHFSDSEKLHKLERRQARAAYIWNRVRADYAKISRL